jgi:uncharacterized phage protein (TIGR02220 family)
MQRFIKYHPDSDMAKYLQTKPIANHLANIIATRARRTDCPYTGLRVGQCFLGNVKKLGITPKQYRTAKKLLERISFSTFEGTNKGTTATLVSIEVYDINVNGWGEQRGEPEGEQKDNQGANKGRQTKNVKKEKNEEELKNKEKESVLLIEQFLEVVEHYQATTGQTLRIGKSDALILRSDKFKKIAPRLKAGATVEECKAVVELKNKQWKDNPKMKSNICIATLFRPSNFEKYLDEIDNTSKSPKAKQFPYELPTFKSKEQRALYFLARYNAYKPQLNEYLINTEYRQRAIMENDAEGLCFELELKMPDLLNIEFNFRT